MRLSIMVGLVTFTYAIDFSMPKVAYLTFIDGFTLTSFASVLMAILTVSVIHVRLRTKGVESVSKFPARARVTFPAAFVAIVAVIAAVSFSR